MDPLLPHAKAIIPYQISDLLHIWPGHRLQSTLRRVTCLPTLLSWWLFVKDSTHHIELFGEHVTLRIIHRWIPQLLYVSSSLAMTWLGLHLDPVLRGHKVPRTNPVDEHFAPVQLVGFLIKLFLYLADLFAQELEWRGIVYGHGAHYSASDGSRVFVLLGLVLLRGVSGFGIDIGVASIILVLIQLAEKRGVVLG